MPKYLIVNKSRELWLRDKADEVKKALKDDFTYLAVRDTDVFILDIPSIGEVKRLVQNADIGFEIGELSFR